MTLAHFKSFIVLVLILVATTPSIAAGPADAVRLGRRFEQFVTLSKLGDAVVRLRWELPTGKYLTLQQRLSTTHKVPDEKGKEVVQRVGVAEALAHYFNTDQYSRQMTITCPYDYIVGSRATIRVRDSTDAEHLRGPNHPPLDRFDECLGRLCARSGASAEGLSAWVAPEHFRDGLGTSGRV
jgi:hypothetical protein